MKVLITGGAGFIGSHLADALIERGADVTVLDRLDRQVHPTGEPPSYLNPKVNLRVGDVRNRENVTQVLHGCDVVFHLAAFVGVGQSQYEIHRYVDGNVGGTANLLQAIAERKDRPKKVLVAASMSSYGEGAYHCEKCQAPRRPPLRSVRQLEKGTWDPPCPACGTALTSDPTPEALPLQGNSVYAVTKWTQEALVLNFGAAYGIPCTALRYFNVYGARQSISNPYTGVAAIFMSRIRNGAPPTIYEDGHQTRDFISVRDAARASLLAMEAAEADGEVFNVGTGDATSILGLAEELLRIMGSNLRPEVKGSFRSGDIRHCVADTTKIRDRLGFSPSVAFEEGMTQLAQWAAEQEAEDRFEEAARNMEERGLVW